jgi:hypothetical protein
MWMILRIGRSSIGRMLLDLKRVRLRTACPSRFQFAAFPSLRRGTSKIALAEAEARAGDVNRARSFSTKRWQGPNGPGIARSTRNCIAPAAKCAPSRRGSENDGHPSIKAGNSTRSASAAPIGAAIAGTGPRRKTPVLRGSRSMGRSRSASTCRSLASSGERCKSRVTRPALEGTVRGPCPLCAALAIPINSVEG